MLIERKCVNEFLKVLRQNVKDMEDIDLALKREVLSQMLKENPLYKELNVDLDDMDGAKYLQKMFDLITLRISGESMEKIQQQVVIGEFLLKEANACCGTPEQYCCSFWKRLGPLCGRENYRGLERCPCQVCEEYEGNIIGIHRGLFMLIHSVIEFLLAYPKIIASYASGDQERTFEPLLAKEDIITSIYQVVQRETQGMIPIPSSEVVFKDERMNLLIFLSSYACLFIMAHELSHFLLGDTTKSPLTRLEIEGQTIEAFAWTDNYEREFKADETGFAILLNYVYSMKKDFEVVRAIAGVETVFLIFELCERIGKHPKSMTHPPAKDRALQLRQKWKFPESYYELSDAFISLGEKGILEDIIKKFNL